MESFPADAHLSSPAAFVEGGVQDPCEDSCSICLEPFSNSNPVTVTSCKHEYHLQCIIEWSQRSKECPMCWQPLSLKDPNSQELLDAVEEERSFRLRSQIPSVFQQTPLGEFEFHVPAYADDSDFEQRIMQHLAAATIGRAHHLARREHFRNRSSSGGSNHPRFLVVPTPLGGTSGGGNSIPATGVGLVSSAQADSQETVASGLHGAPASNRPSRSAGNFIRVNDLNRADTFPIRQRAGLEPVQEIQQRTSTEPSELHPFSESWKSRLAAASSRYKETLTKTTRGFRERLRAHTNMTDVGARAREVSAGVVRAFERISLESTGRVRGDINSRATDDMPSDVEGCSALTKYNRDGAISSINGDGTSEHGNFGSTSNIAALQPLIADKVFESPLSMDIQSGTGIGSSNEHGNQLSATA